MRTTNPNRPDLKPEDVRRFWYYVDCRNDEECWPWKARCQSGYGYFSALGKEWRAHRVALFLATKEWPPCVLHSCDNPPCCNPRHLRSGTQLENRQDSDLRYGKRHLPKGIDHHKSKLTEQQVREIRSSKRARGLSKKYGVNKSTIRRIRERLAWVWLD